MVSDHYTRVDRSFTAWWYRTLSLTFPTTMRPGYQLGDQLR